MDISNQPGRTPAAAPSPAPAPTREPPLAATPALPRFERAARLVRWWIPAGAVMTFFGYWGPWIAHPTAGLTLSGIDLGEFVKFLPTVRSGELEIWREAFYLPAVALSLCLSLAAYRPEFRFNYLTRLGMIIGALIGAGWLLPPAWSPLILLTPEFRLQTASMALCVLISLSNPLITFLPRPAALGAVTAANTLGIALPLWTLWSIWDAVHVIYAEPLQLGWGPVWVIAGLSLALAGWWLTPSLDRIRQV